MSSQHNIFLSSEGPIISARKAAKRLGYSQDYIGKLCREGKLDGRLIDNAWFVHETSLLAFESKNALAKQERSEGLSELRRKENKIFREAKGLPPIVSKSKEDPHTIFSRSFTQHPFLKTATLSFGGLFLFAAVAFAGAAGYSQSNPFAVMPRALTAALSHVESPFFGISPAVPQSENVSEPSFGNFFSTIFGYVFGNHVPQIASNTPSTPVVQVPVNVPPTKSSTSTSTPPKQTSSQTIVQNNTYPVIEHTVVQTKSGITQADLDAQLAQLSNTLNQEIYNFIHTPPPVTTFSGNTFVPNSPSTLSITDADVPDNITASNYLLLGGGTLTGDLNNTSTGTSTFNGGLSAANLALTNALGITSGGTGLTSYNTGDILYASAPNTLSVLPIGSNGRVLKVSGGVPTWGLDISGGGGGSGAWATTTDNLAIYPSDPTQVVVIGNNATSTNGNILEVVGNSLFGGNVVSYGTVTTRNFVATSSTASIFPYASSTALTVSGIGYFGTASTTNLTVSSIASGVLLKTTTGGAVVAAVPGTDFENPLSFNAPLGRIGNAISITQSGLSTDGYLSSANFNLFNNKVSSTSLSGSSVISYNSSTGVITTAGGTFGAGDYAFPGNLTVSGNATTTNFFATTASSTNLSTSNLSIASLNGILKATNGLVSAASAGSDYQVPLSFTYPLSNTSNTISLAFGTTTANTWSQLQTFAGGFLSSASSTINGNLTIVGNSTTTQATTTNLAILGLTSTLLKTNANGSVIPAIAGTDFENALTFNAPLGRIGNAISITQSGTGSDGYLSSIDFNTFNNKISSTSLSGTSVISYSASTGVITTTGGTFGAGNYIFPGALTASGLATFGNASTSILSIANGTATTTLLANATSTFGAGIQATALNVTGSATSTFANGIDLAAGCFSVGGACLSTTGGGGSAFGKSWEIVNGYLAPTSTIGIIVNASSTIGNGTQPGGLTINGGATTTGNALISGALNVSGLSTLSNLLLSGSTTLQNFTFGNATGTSATTTNFAILGITSSLLKTLSNGAVVAAVAGTDYSNFSYPFPGNATTTQIAFNGGLTATSATTTALFSSVYQGTTLAIGGTSTTTIDSAGNLLVQGGTSAGTSLDVNGTINGLYYSVQGSQFIDNAKNANINSLNVGLGNATIDSNGNATTTNATTTSLFASNVTIGSLNGLLKATAGVISTAIAGTDYSNFGYLFPNNATTTQLSFNGGASTTVFSATGPSYFGGTATSTFAINGTLTTPGITLSNITGSTQCLRVNSSGTVSGTGSDCGSGSGTTNPGGSDTQVQFNDGGVFGGDAAFTFNKISGLLSISQLLVTSSTTLQNFTSKNSTTTNATTTSLAITGITSSLLKTLSNGAVVAAVAGTDYVTGAAFSSIYPFPLTGNATSTLTQFNGGLTAFASSTIGNGTATGGLTISGNSTTTGSAYIAGTLTVPGSSGISITDNVGVGSPLLKVGDDSFFTDLDIANTLGLYGFSDNTVASLKLGSGGGVISGSNGKIGIGTTNPADALQVGDGTADTRLSVVSNSVNQFTAKNASGNSIKYGATTDTIPNAVISNNDGNPILTITTGGNVGIGTTSPFAALSVSGNAFLNGNFTASNINATGTLAVTGLSTLTGGILTNASSTLGNFTALNATTSQATTTSFAITGITSSLLKTLSNGAVVAALAGTDYSNFAYPFPGNATTTQIAFNGGATFAGATTTALAVTGSTTISSVLNVGGALNANGALTVSGTTLLQQATSTSFAISGISSGNILKTATGGAIVAAVAGTDYITPADLASAYPFQLTGNATSTLTQFNGGLTSASTTLTGSTTLANATSSSIYTNLLGINSSYFSSLLGTGLINSGGALTVSNVPNTSLQNSTIGLTDTNSTLTIGGSPAALGGSLSATLNLAHSNNFSALQQFGGGASTTNLSALAAFFGSSATTSINGAGDLFVAGSTTLQNFTFGNATGTAATTTSFAISSQSAGCAQFNAMGGLLSTGVSCGSGGGAGFNFLINYGVISAATTSPIWVQAGIFASSTSHFVDADFTNATTTNFAISSLTGILKASTGGKIIAAVAGSDFENPLAFNNPLSRIGNAISITQSGLGADGYLSSGDFTTFNNKISSTSLSGTSVISYSASTGVITTTGGTFGAGNYVFPGNVTVNGNASTTNIYASGTISGGGLTSCSSGSDKLLWNVSTQQFACGTDLNSGGTGEINWTYFNGSGVRTSTSTNQVLIGFTSTSTLSKLEVIGGATIDNATTTNFYSNLVAVGNKLGIGTSSPSSALTVAGGNITQVASGNPTIAATVAEGVGHNTTGAYISGRYAYSSDYEGGLRIIDISNPKQPTVVGSNSTYTGSPTARAVVVAGKYAYVADENTGLFIFDVSNPSAPSVVGSYPIGGTTRSLAISGKYVFIDDINNNATRIIDVSNPTSPTLAGSFISPSQANPGSPKSLAVQGKYLYIADLAPAIYIVDISNPTAPALVGSYTGSNASSPSAIYVSGKYAYVSDQDKGLYSLDISNPSLPVAVGKYPVGAAHYAGVQIAGNYAYVAENDSGVAYTKVIDVSASTTFQLVGSVAHAGTAQNLVVSGKYAYLADTDFGLDVVDLNGFETPGANIGSLESNTANISDNLNVGGDIFAGGGIAAGISGISSRGIISAFIASTTQANPVVATFMGGNVGIGTTSPFVALSVVGSAFLNGNLTASNITATGTVAVAGLSTLTGGILTNASSTFGNFTALNATTSQATTTSFAITGITSSLLKTLSNGAVAAALAGTDYITGAGLSAAYPFPSNATTTQIAFNGGATFAGATTTALAVTGSSTISGVLNSTFANNLGSTTLLGNSLFFNATTTNFGVTNINSPVSQTLAIKAADGGASAGSNLTISAGNNTSGAAAGGSVTVSAGDSVNSVGGDFTIKSGSGQDSAAFGAITFKQGSLTRGGFDSAGSFSIGTDKLFIGSGGVASPNTNVGIGTTSPFAKLSVQGTNGSTNTTLFAIGSSTGSVNSTLFSVANTGSTTIANGVNISAGCYAINGSCIGTTPPGATGQISYFSGTNVQQGTSTVFISPSSKVGIGTTSPYGKLTVWGADSAAGTLAFLIANSASTTAFSIDDAGNGYLAGKFGIGTSSPTSLLSVNGTTANAQVTVAYDTTHYGTMQISAVGDLVIDSSNGNVRMNNDNLFICQGGACPTSTATSTAGNLFVENAVTIGDGFSLKEIDTNNLGLYNTSGVLMVTFDNGI